jgi:hypothetical protein
MNGRMFLRIASASLALLAGLALPLRAQSNPVPLPDALAKELAARASDYTEVTLDRKMLDFASRFMNDKDDAQAQGKRIIAKLNGVYVRTYEFDKPGQYTESDLAQIRQAFAGPDWSPMVKERSKEESNDIYMKTVNGEIQGMFILDAEPKELDIVYIDGPIRPEDLTDLGGNFGIPSNLGGAKNLTPSPNPLLKNRKAGPQ